MAYDYNIIKDRLIQNVGSLTQEELKSTIDKLLEYMKLESQKEEQLGHKPIYDSDFPNDPDNPDDPNSLFETINWRADLDAGETAINFDSILTSEEALDKDGIWNQSVKALIQKYRDNLLIDEAIIPGTNERIKISDIKNANAGKSFNGTAWVNPNVNIDGKTYDDVRDKDKIEQVLNSNRNLQFTINTINKYIRLIMPQYTRRVEVEDLNRNFWVIGQTLAGISAFLFDDSSPLKAILKQSISEIMQLWENILYLWAAVELLNQKEAKMPEPEEIPYVYSQTICQVIDIPRANDKPLRDINEFVNKFDWDKTETKLNQFTKMYSGKHLAFLLRCRIGNYEKDYYHTEIYPYVAFYDANSKQWTRTELWNRNAEYTSYTYDFFPFGVTLRIDSDAKIDGKLYNGSYNVQNIRDRVYAIRESANSIRPNEYCFYYPLSEMPPYDTYKHPGSSTVMPAPTDESNANAYRAIVRIKPTITTNYDNDDTYIKVKIKFEIEDIARKLHWLTRASSDNPADDAQNDKYRDYKDINGTVYNPKYNIITSTGTDSDGFYEANSTSDGGHIIIQINWDNWGKPYNASSNPHGTLNGFSTNFRDSGYQGSLCDMITYRGVSKSNSSSNG